MIDGDIKNHQDPGLPGLRKEQGKGGIPAEPWIHGPVVADVESLVSAGGSEQGQDPEGPDPQVFQPIHLAGQEVQRLSRRSARSGKRIPVAGVHKTGRIEP